MPTFLIDDIANNKNKVFAHNLGLHLELEYIQPGFKDMLNEIKFVRDKVLSHNELREKSLSIKVTTIRSLIDFAKKIISIVDLAFFNTVHNTGNRFALTYIAEREGSNIPQILVDMGVKTANTGTIDPS